MIPENPPTHIMSWRELMTLDARKNSRAVNIKANTWMAVIKVNEIPSVHNVIGNDNITLLMMVTHVTTRIPKLCLLRQSHGNRYGKYGGDIPWSILSGQAYGLNKGGQRWSDVW